MRRASSSGKVSDRAALACLYGAYNRYQRKPFLVDVNGPNHAALKRGQHHGWVWFQAPDRAVITVEGMRALEPYGVRAEA